MPSTQAPKSRSKVVAVNNISSSLKGSQATANPRSTGRGNSTVSASSSKQTAPTTDEATDKEEEAPLVVSNHKEETESDNSASAVSKTATKRRREAADTAPSGRAKRSNKETVEEEEPSLQAQPVVRRTRFAVPVSTSADSLSLPLSKRSSKRNTSNTTPVALKVKIPSPFHFILFAKCLNSVVVLGLG